MKLEKTLKDLCPYAKVCVRSNYGNFAECRLEYKECFLYQKYQKFKDSLDKREVETRERIYRMLRR